MVGKVTAKSVEIARPSPRATAILFGLRGFTAAVVGSFPLSPVCTSFDADATVKQQAAMMRDRIVRRVSGPRVRMATSRKMNFQWSRDEQQAAATGCQFARREPSFQNGWTVARII